jgi:hypothetical protein
VCRNHVPHVALEIEVYVAYMSWIIFSLLFKTLLATVAITGLRVIIRITPPFTVLSTANSQVMHVT